MVDVGPRQLQVQAKPKSGSTDISCLLGRGFGKPAAAQAG